MFNARVTQLLSDPHVNGWRGVEPSLVVRTTSKRRRGTGILDGEEVQAEAMCKEPKIL